MREIKDQFSRINEDVRIRDYFKQCFDLKNEINSLKIQCAELQDQNSQLLSYKKVADQIDEFKAIISTKEDEIQSLNN